LKEGYSDKFGFTEVEIEKMLNDFNIVKEKMSLKGGIMDIYLEIQ
jgi:hypothetical protein